MQRTKINRRVQLITILALAAMAINPAFARANDIANGPELPAECGSIRAPEGARLALHVYARGVQIYKWNATTATWDFDAPRASLFAEENYFGEVGIHYRGPNWESKSGSKVGGKRVAGTGCTPDASAIAWLLLDGVDPTGPGIFDKVTHIQRVNTVGGIAPATPGLVHGEVKEVPYTAEYYFYRAQN